MFCSGDPVVLFLQTDGVKMPNRNPSMFRLTPQKSEIQFEVLVGEKSSLQTNAHVLPVKVFTEKMVISACYSG